MNRYTMEAVREKLKKTRAFLCLECGKCTAVCPISSYDQGYSPRRMLADGLFYNADEIISDKLLWSCLTCQLCSQRCPVDVGYSEYMKDVRAEAYRQGKWGSPAHGNALLYIMEMTAAPKLKQNRTGWINGDLKTRKKGDVLYFVGCLPYYQDFFSKDLEFEPLSIGRDTIKILNYIGIEPVVLDNERCCGHDLYWLGQTDKFEQLAALNLKEIESTGAKTVVTACPECATALKQLYSEKFGANGFDVKHISEMVAENIDKFKFNNLEKEVTFHDPCRLGRFMDVYDAPRRALESIPGIKMHEMQHTRRGAICCGTTNWMNCGSTSHQIQKSRLNEAQNTGAGTMVTACPKCRIHFQCSQCGNESDRVEMELADFVNIIASAL